MSKTTDQPEMSPIAAAAYGTFLWQLMKARPALKSLSDQAFAAKDRDAISAIDASVDGGLLHFDGLVPVVSDHGILSDICRIGGMSTA